MANIQNKKYINVLINVANVSDLYISISERCFYGYNYKGNKLEYET